MIDDLEEFPHDYLFVKFASLKYPAILPWLEVGAGTFVPEESTEDELVFLTKKKSEEGVVSADSGDNTPSKSHLKKTALMGYIESQLRKPSDPEVIDYGPVEDFRIQPAGQVMTKDVFMFLARYET